MLLTKPFTQSSHWLPCLNGPLDGSEVRIRDGAKSLCHRDDFGNWHAYRVEPDETSYALVYHGKLEKPEGCG